MLSHGLGSIQSGIDALRRCADAGLSAKALGDVVRSGFAMRNQLDAALTLLVSSLDHEIEKQRQDGDPTTSCAAFLRDELLMNSGAAHGQVQLARQLRDLPDTATAFASGQLSSAHCTSLTRTVQRVLMGGGQPEVAERVLLGEARQRSPYDLLVVGRHLRHRLNPEELAEEEEQEHQRQWLNLTRSSWNGGLDLEGHLDAEAGTALKEAIESVMGPRRKDDERPPALRRAHAFNELVRRCLDAGELPVRGGQRPHIVVYASLETMRGDPGAPAAELSWGWPISGQAARRLAASPLRGGPLRGDVTPLLLGENGDPLHMGRRRRTASPKQRVAMAFRDRHCTWIGCDREPAWCDGNHDRLWIEGGRTDIDEMALLSRLHHGKFHAGWRLRRLADGRVEVVPPPRAGPVFGPAVHSPPPAS